MIGNKDGNEGPDRSTLEGIARETESDGLKDKSDGKGHECRLGKNGPIRTRERNEILGKRTRQFLLFGQTEPKNQERLGEDHHQSHNTTYREDGVLLHD